MLGGTVSSGVVGGEYGRMPIHIQAGSRLYSYQDNTSPNVWMSHGDEATKLPDGFRVVAKSSQVRKSASQHCPPLALCCRLLLGFHTVLCSMHAGSIEHPLSCPCKAQLG